MSENINTREYWEERFASGSWEERDGPQHTIGYAMSNLAHMHAHLPEKFSGSLLDFGCATGNAMPAYAAAYPEANLIGMDISESSILSCRAKFGELAQFRIGDHTEVPEVDVIVASHVLEHLDDDVGIARHLLSKCQHLFIFVPWRERPGAVREHVHTYDLDGFSELGNPKTAVYDSLNNIQRGKKLWIDIYLKNLVRPLIGRRLVSKHKSVMYYFQSG